MKRIKINNSGIDNSIKAFKGNDTQCNQIKSLL